MATNIKHEKDESQGKASKQTLSALQKQPTNTRERNKKVSKKDLHDMNNKKQIKITSYFFNTGSLSNSSEQVPEIEDTKITQLNQEL